MQGTRQKPIITNRKSCVHIIFIRHGRMKVMRITKCTADSLITGENPFILAILSISKEMSDAQIAAKNCTGIQNAILSETRRKMVNIPF